MDSGNEYVVQVKKNQPSLYHQILTIQQKSQCIDVHKTNSFARGRDENREVSIYICKEEFFDGWPKVNRIVHVLRYGKRSGKSYFVDNYYISSLEVNQASIFAKGIRSHWHIENRLHWVKDVIQNEDKSRIKNKNTAAVMSAFRQLIINIYRLKGHRSIKFATEIHNNRLDKCLQIIKKLHIHKFRTV